MTTKQTGAIHVMQRGLDKLGHSPGAVDGQWGIRTAHALRQLIAANGRPASVSPQRPLPWITEAKSALGHNEARHRSWLMDWLTRDGRSLGDPSKDPWCGDFVETCSRMGLPDEPLLCALGTNPYWARNRLLFGQAVQPITGAVLIFERGSGGHVGFAVGHDDTHFYVLGGNQSDAVTIARIAMSRLLGARWSPSGRWCGRSLINGGGNATLYQSARSTALSLRENAEFKFCMVCLVSWMLGIARRGGKRQCDLSMRQAALCSTSRGHQARIAGSSPLCVALI